VGRAAEYDCQAPAVEPLGELPAPDPAGTL